MGPSLEEKLKTFSHMIYRGPLAKDGEMITSKFLTKPLSGTSSSIHKIIGMKSENLIPLIPTTLTE